MRICRLTGINNIFLSYQIITEKITNSTSLLVIKGRKCIRIYSKGMLLHHLILIRKYGEWKSRNILKQLKNKPDFVIDAGNLKPSKPSTVIDLTKGIKILRK